ncbi:PT domain-containing protein [Herbivorax sp. ANBcel31]|uniref:PT domain-containing protein n=1 Tax=Herbivorax sp. ANBcel31 TaxID=3069754 RepID=UPI0027AE8D94|nr:PT domain-containing protein [Herbivorax sp. ANBcel31]MDQ2087859.1 PT domain-containing protein [Herbivorax sp. ANBcel31]
MKKYIYLLLICCISLGLALMLSGCGDNVEPISTPESTDQATPESTDQARPEPTDQATNGSTDQATPEPTESILSVAEAQDLLIESFDGYHHRIEYLPNTKKREDGILQYGFSVDYSESYRNPPPNTIAYAWVNSVTGEIRIEESDLYANIPDSKFPVPMINGEIISYDYFSLPNHVTGLGYHFSDENVMEMEIYQEQLREAGFVDHGEVMAIASMWSYKRDKDGAKLVVELRNGGDGGNFDISMYVSY